MCRPGHILWLWLPDLSVVLQLNQKIFYSVTDQSEQEQGASIISHKVISDRWFGKRGFLKPPAGYETCAGIPIYI